MRHSIRFTLLLLLVPLTALLTGIVWLIQAPALAALDQLWSSVCQQTSLAPSLCLQPETSALWSLVALAVAFTLFTASLIASALISHCAKDLQQQLLEVQKGLQDQLTEEVPSEVSGLVQQINRLLSVHPGTVEPKLHGHPALVIPDQPPVKPVQAAAPVPQPEAPTASSPVPSPKTNPKRPPAEERPFMSAPDKAPAPARPARPSGPEAPATLATRDPDTVPVFRSNPRTDTTATAQQQSANPRQQTTPKSSTPAPNQKPASAAAESRSHTAPETKGSVPVRQIYSIVKQLEQRYPGKHYDLITELDEDFPWPTRAADLDEVLVNLLDNAGRWAHAQINVFLASKSNVLALEVADDGPGVSPDQLDHLGTPGLTLDQKDGGKGLGLATVRYIIGQYGGGLAFSTSRLGGLEVLATLPRTRPALHSLGATSRQDPLASRRDPLKGAKIH